jgi:CubicO group peptidase (beta-lactamase class C family)
MKIFKRAIFLVLAGGLGYGIYYASQALPILSGYGAKDLCSCVFVAGRQTSDVIKNELGKAPLSMGSFSIDYSDSSATGSVLGFAQRKAIYRKGLGCTLLAEISEDDLRSQHPALAWPMIRATDSIDWPMGDRVTDTMLGGINYEKIHQTLKEAFTEPGEKKLRRLRSVVIVYKGQIIAEKYAEGYTKDTRQIGWSMSKSINSALVGILVKDGKLKVEAPAPIKLWQKDERSRITLNDLLHASSGLAWEENYAGPSGATNMLFKKKDMGLYAALSPTKYKPGEFFYYSSGTANIIARIVRDAIGDEGYYKFPYQRLFNKIGMHNTILEPDAGGTFVGSSYSFGTARDWTRFGLLYLNDGVWNGERIFPEGWVKYTATAASAAPIGQYGAQFWLNAGAPGNPSNRRYPDVPTDLLSADGFEGQNVWIIPSKNLVVTKLSLEQGNYLDDNKFLADIISSLP